VPDNEIIRLVHEVHQIELEMQNEALLLAQSQADSATKNKVNYMIYYLRDLLSQ
jgi:hypothetical protein